MALALPVLLGGCGESKEAKARKTVCAARAQIKRRVEHLQTLTPSLQSVPEIRNDVTAIGSELKKIKEAQQDLSPARRKEVQEATERFEKEAGEALSSVGASGSVSKAEAELSTALHRFRAAFVTSLEPINCG
jgi:hypothetical protein